MNETPSWDLPPPVLFNPWKHHAAALRQRIRDSASRGDAGLAALTEQLLVVGTELMDLYTGVLTPAQIAEEVLTQLRTAGRLERDVFRGWVEEHHGYQLVTAVADSSVWVLRCANDDRYVHVHPGRWTP